MLVVLIVWLIAVAGTVYAACKAPDYYAMGCYILSSLFIIATGLVYLLIR